MQAISISNPYSTPQCRNSISVQCLLCGQFSASQWKAELIHAHGSLDAILSYELLGDELSGIIHTWTMADLFDECYAFLPGLGALGAVPASSKDSILTARPVTTCTIDGKTTTGVPVKSLDRGEKAGAAIGKFITYVFFVVVELR